MKYKPFNDVIQKRDNITKREMRRIRKLYNEWAREVKAKAKSLKVLGSPSSIAEEKKLARLYYELRNASRQLSAEIDRSVRNGADDVGEIVVNVNKRWLRSLGMNIDSFEYRFSVEKRIAISKVINGQIYKDFGGLSEKVWNISNGHERDIYNIISKGIATEMNAYDIALNLEKYLNPSKRLKWSNVSKGKNGEPIRFPVKNHAIDYNAVRLLRTTLQHVYQQSVIEMTKNSPFVEGYLWIAAGNHPCPLCLDRDGKIFKASEVPYDHPNGRCEIEPVVNVEKAMRDIEEFNRNPIEYPDLLLFTSNIARF